MDESKKQEFVSEAKGLAKFFEVDLTVKLFGKLVWSWHWPPQS